jgi:2-oxoglutarate ferredoxin oxidoreductase subunit delta
MPRVRIDKDRCKGCGLCVDNCPQKVLEMSKDINIKGYFYSSPVRQHHCIGCRICAIVCPDVAIEVSVNGVHYHYFAY